MTATVHVLHAKPMPSGSFLRIGHTGHRKLEALIAASRLRFRRFVFDAAHVDDQKDLLATLRRAGCEIVLDPNAAETATLGRFAEHFLLHHLDPAVRSSRVASRLKFGNDHIAKLIDETKKRLTNLRDPLGDLHSTSDSETRSATPRFRGNNQTSQAAVS